jgi:hypothetical protein
VLGLETVSASGLATGRSRGGGRSRDRRALGDLRVQEQHLLSLVGHPGHLHRHISRRAQRERMRLVLSRRDRERTRWRTVHRDVDVRRRTVAGIGQRDDEVPVTAARRAVLHHLRVRIRNLRSRCRGRRGCRRRTGRRGWCGTRSRRRGWRRRRGGGRSRSRMRRRCRGGSDDDGLADVDLRVPVAALLHAHLLRDADVDRSHPRSRVATHFWMTVRSPQAT